jgi:hypothetical protein
LFYDVLRDHALNDTNPTFIAALICLWPAGESLSRQIQALFTLCVGLGLGLAASWKLGLVVLATFPLATFAAYIQMQAISGQQYDTDVGGKAGHGSLISSAFTQMRTVSAFSVQLKVSILNLHISFIQ